MERPKKPKNQQRQKIQKYLKQEQNQIENQIKIKEDKKISLIAQSQSSGIYGNRSGQNVQKIQNKNIKNILNTTQLKSAPPTAYQKKQMSTIEQKVGQQSQVIASSFYEKDQNNWNKKSSHNKLKTSKPSSGRKPQQSSQFSNQKEYGQVSNIYAFQSHVISGQYNNINNDSKNKSDIKINKKQENDQNNKNYNNAKIPIKQLNQQINLMAYTFPQKKSQKKQQINELRMTHIEHDIKKVDLMKNNGIFASSPPTSIKKIIQKQKEQQNNNKSQKYKVASVIQEDSHQNSSKGTLQPSNKNKNLSSKISMNIDKLHQKDPNLNANFNQSSLSQAIKINSDNLNNTYKSHKSHINNINNEKNNHFIVPVSQSKNKNIYKSQIENFGMINDNKRDNSNFIQSNRKNLVNTQKNSESSFRPHIYQDDKSHSKQISGFFHSPEQNQKSDYKIGSPEALLQRALENAKNSKSQIPPDQVYNSFQNSHQDRNKNQLNLRYTHGNQGKYTYYYDSNNKIQNHNHNQSNNQVTVSQFKKSIQVQEENNPQSNRNIQQQKQKQKQKTNSSIKLKNKNQGNQNILIEELEDNARQNQRYCLCEFISDMFKKRNE